MLIHTNARFYHLEVLTEHINFERFHDKDVIKVIETSNQNTGGHNLYVTTKDLGEITHAHIDADNILTYPNNLSIPFSSKLTKEVLYKDDQLKFKKNAVRNWLQPTHTTPERRKEWNDYIFDKQLAKYHEQIYRHRQS